MEEIGTYLASVNLAATLPSGSRAGSQQSIQHSRNSSQAAEGNNNNSCNGGNAESIIRNLFPAVPPEALFRPEFTLQKTSTGDMEMHFENLAIQDVESGMEGGVFAMDAPRQLKLRLPAAGAHRRVRSLEALPRQN